MSRLPRDAQTRDSQTRAKPYRPPSALDAPQPKSPDVHYRLIRVAAAGESDAKNVGKRTVEGYVPVMAEEHPEYRGARVASGPYEGAIGVGDLVLFKNAKDNVESRQDYYAEQAARQIQAIDSDMFRDQDRRMPMQIAERKSETGRMPAGPRFRDG